MTMTNSDTVCPDIRMGENGGTGADKGPSIINLGCWIPIEAALPEVEEDGYSNWILISFENFTMPCIGQYRVDPDGSGAFYEGDEAEPLIRYGLIVNAWMPCPDCYRGAPYSDCPWG